MRRCRVKRADRHIRRWLSAGPSGAQRGDCGRSSKRQRHHRTAIWRQHDFGQLQVGAWQRARYSDLARAPIHHGTANSRVALARSISRWSARSDCSDPDHARLPCESKLIGVIGRIGMQTWAAPRNGGRDRSGRHWPRIGFAPQPQPTGRCRDHATARIRPATSRGKASFQTDRDPPHPNIMASANYVTLHVHIVVSKQRIRPSTDGQLFEPSSAATRPRVAGCR